MTEGAKLQPARGSPRMLASIRPGARLETTEFAHRRDKRRRKAQLAKASRRKNR